MTSAWRRLILYVSIALIAAVAAGCSAGDATSGNQSPPADGRIIAMTKVRNPTFPPTVPAGSTLYSIKYGSRGHVVQGYLDVPPGKGPFQLFVDLHGGSVFPVRHIGQYAWTRDIAADLALPADVVFLPNYQGYGPSPGPVVDPYDDYLDVQNGLKALGNIRGLHIARAGTFVEGTSLGGYVAMKLAANDPQVRVAALLSPYPGDALFMQWLLSQPPDALDRVDLAYEKALRQAFGKDTRSRSYGLNSFDYSRIRIPVLIVAGTSDPIMPTALVRDMYGDLRKYDRQVTLDVVPGGHAPFNTSVGSTLDRYFLNHGLNPYY